MSYVEQPSANTAFPTNTSPYSDLPPFHRRLLDAKAKSNLTFDQIAQKLGKNEVWVAAAFYAQAKLDFTDLAKLCEVLNLPTDLASQAIPESWYPQRGLGPMPPTDPVLYRLYEGVMVYGQAIKSVIHEKFGDGIMSMIDCEVHVEKKPNPKGDRVVLTFDGKFLPYSKW